MGRASVHGRQQGLSIWIRRRPQKRDRPLVSPKQHALDRLFRAGREELGVAWQAAYSTLSRSPPQQKCAPVRINQGAISISNQHGAIWLLLPRTRPRPNLPAKSFRMPEEETIEWAREDARQGKSPSTQAGEFVREEIEHIREGKHGARSTKQAIAIGLSKARRVGVKLPPPRKGASARTKKQAARDSKKGQGSRRRKPSARRSRAVRKALKREPRSAASHRALSRQARSTARRRSRADRSRAARKAAKTRRKTRK